MCELEVNNSLATLQCYCLSLSWYSSYNKGDSFLWYVAITWTQTMCSLRSNLGHAPTASSHHQPQLVYLSIPQQQAFHFFLFLHSPLLPYLSYNLRPRCTWLYKWCCFDQSVGAEGECLRRSLSLVNAALRMKSYWSGNQVCGRWSSSIFLVIFLFQQKRGFTPSRYRMSLVF